MAEVEAVLATAGLPAEVAEPTPGVCPICHGPVERRGARGPLPTYCSAPCKNSSAAPAPERLEALATLVLFCGLRQAEALDLRWEHLDLDGDEPVAHVHGTKSDASGRRVPREVPLPGRVVEALRRHRRAQLKERMASKYWNDPGLVFATSIGTRYDKRAVVRWWHALTLRAGVGRRHFHSSRHTAGTVMLNAGVELEVVSVILGHSSLAITSDIYAKPGRALKRGAAEAMDRLFGAGP